MGLITEIILANLIIMAFKGLQLSNELIGEYYIAVSCVINTRRLRLYAPRGVYSGQIDGEDRSAWSQFYADDDRLRMHYTGNHGDQNTRQQT